MFNLAIVFFAGFVFGIVLILGMLHLLALRSYRTAIDDVEDD